MIQDPFRHALDPLEARPHGAADTQAGTWACIGCGQVRPGGSAWRVVVRNRTRAPQRREIRLCQVCVEDLVRIGQLSADLIDARQSLERSP